MSADVYVIFRDDDDTYGIAHNGAVYADGYSHLPQLCSDLLDKVLNLPMPEPVPGMSS